MEGVGLNIGSKTDDEKSFPDLRNAEINGLQNRSVERVPGSLVDEFPEIAEVFTAVHRQKTWNIFKEKRFGSQPRYQFKILDRQLTSGILHGLPFSHDAESLTRRPCNNQVDIAMKS